jgi:hypothetical protein
MAAPVVAPVAKAAIPEAASSTAPAVTAAGGSKAGSTAANLIGSSGISLDINSTTPQGMIAKVLNRRQYENEVEEETRRFDVQFDEDKRRFGLNYALQQFAMRANMSFQQAQALYQRQAGQVQQGMEYQNFSQGMKEKRKAFQWANEDRATKKKFDNAFTRGLARGLKTGGK